MKYQIPTYETSDEAVRAFMRLVQHKRNQELLRETPSSLPEEFTPDIDMARRLIAEALAGGRHHLNGHDSLRLLAAYGIPVLDSQVAADPAAAETIAARLGRAVALKILSPDIPSKSQVGGVRLTYDVTYQVALWLKHALKDDDTYRGFRSHGQDCVRALPQTARPFLKPPTPRRKARGQPMSEPVAWAQKALADYDRGPFEELAPGYRQSVVGS